jgi:hypothetical protein
MLQVAAEVNGYVGDRHEDDAPGAADIHRRELRDARRAEALPAVAAPSLPYYPANRQ